MIKLMYVSCRFYKLQIGPLADADRLSRSESCGICHMTLSVPLNDHMALMHPGCGFPEGHSNCGNIAGKTIFLLHLINVFRRFPLFSMIPCFVF